MPYQDINVTLSEQDLQEIKQSIATIQQELPFLITLTATERRRLFKMGDRRLVFVQTSLNAAQSNQNILPASFDLNGFTNDYRLATTLTEVDMLLSQLNEQVDDTLLAVGSEAMASSLTVYDYVKTAAKKTPGLKGIAEQLGSLFRAIRSKSAKSSTEGTAAAS